MQSILSNIIIPPKPFLKWAGGKKQVINEINKKLPLEIKNGEITKYFEPFLGGGAVFFNLINNYDFDEVYLGDINKDLILTYNVVKNNSEDLIDILFSIQEEYLIKDDEERKEYYYNMRDDFNGIHKFFDVTKYSHDLVRAAQMIFLNKTCFNGLYRVNKNGKFNVPMGRYKNPTICDASNIDSVAQVLENITIKNATYLESENLIDKNSFVYLDPPYRPLNKTSQFTNYSNNIFADEQQIELKEFYERISSKGAKVILSNSDPKNEDPEDNFFDDLYRDFNIERIDVKRVINSKSHKRGAIKEILVMNY